MKSIAILVLLLVSSSNLINAQTLMATAFVNEGEVVTACVTYTTAPGSETVIVLSTLNNELGGAVATTGGGDFISLIEMLTFGPGMDLEQCRDIQTLADEALEGFELFTIQAVLNGTIIGSTQSAINNVGAITVGFSETSYSFAEDQSSQEACIVIEGNGTIEGNLMVRLTVNLTDGTATDADGDFDSSLLTAFNIDLIKDTPRSGKCFAVPITTDQIVESDEMFVMVINNNADGQSQLSPTNSEAEVTITNDDALCNDPPALTEGTFSLSISREEPPRRGDTAMYNCSTGYNLIGDSRLTCELGDIWSPANPGTCEGLDCAALSDPDNGEVDTSAGTIFPSGMATYSCEEGYVLNEDITRMCQNDGIWSGEAPTCEPRDCDSLTIANGVVVLPQGMTTFPAMATYSCTSAGYGLVGESTRNCQANGTWSGSEPTCMQFTCQKLPLPANGNVSPREGFLGDIATYTCDETYTLLGNEERTCQAGGSWSGTAPTCDEIQVTPTGGGLTQEQTVGIGVGVSIAGAIILILVIVAVIILVVYVRRKRADKYVLNYSTVYGNQRKNEMSSRPVEPTEENVYQERSVDSPPREAEVEDSLAKEQS